jgi:hypothetical protein
LKKSRAVLEHFLAVLREALGNIGEERLFQDERGYQAELLQELGRRLERGSLPGDPIIQQEYQKRLPLHKIRIRPDIIVHVPFDRGLAKTRDEGNFVAIELKRCATAKTARQAFANLALMKKALKYPLTIFINVDSEETHRAICPKSIAGQTVCFAVLLEEGKPVVRTAKGRLEQAKRSN